MSPKPRPACPRCGGMEFMMVKVAAGGVAHICDDCQWPRDDNRGHTMDCDQPEFKKDPSND